MIQSFLRDVCSYVSNKQMHDVIRKELESHIFELMEEYKENGMNEKKAEKKAIQMMGAPKEIGQRFENVYAPKFNWNWLILLGIVCIGSIGFLAVEGIRDMHSQARLDYNDPLYFAKRQAGKMLIGIIVMVMMLFLDLAKIKKYAKSLYICSSLLIISLIVLNKMDVNAFDSYRVPIGISYLIIPLLVGLVGIFTTKKWWQCALYIGFTYVLYITCVREFKQLVICAIVLYVCVLFSSMSLRYKLGSFAGLTVLNGSLLLIMKIWYPIYWKILWVFLNPYQEPDYWSFQQILSLDLLKHSTMIGKGTELSYKGNLPETHTEFLFSYLSHEIGWLIPLAVVFVFSILLFHTVKRHIKSSFSYEKMISMVCVTLLFVPFLWNVLMQFSLMPLERIPMPFISYAGLRCNFYFILIGLLFNLERKKSLYKHTLSID